MGRTDTRLANEAWESFLTAHAAVIKELASDDIWTAVSMREYDVLYTLSKCAGAIRQSELNRHVLLSQPALSRMVDRLVGRGLIERTTDPVDGRGVRIALTADGRAVQRQIGGRHAIAVARAMTSRLSSEQLHQLYEICRRLTEPEPEPGPGAAITDHRSEA